MIYNIHKYASRDQYEDLQYPTNRFHPSEYLALSDIEPPEIWFCQVAYEDPGRIDAQYKAGGQNIEAHHLVDMS